MEVGVQKAATRLGLSIDAVRRRVKAGKIESRKEPDGRVLITLPNEPPASDPLAETAKELAIASQALAETERALAECRGDLAREREALVAARRDAQSAGESLAEEKRALAERRKELAAAQSRIVDLEKALAVAEARLEAAEERIATAEGERDYLRSAHAASLSLSQRLLPERVETPQNRAWWRVWER